MRRKEAHGAEPRPVVPLGRIVITANALEQLAPHDVRLAIERHANGDWGDVDPIDSAQNDLALNDDQRLLSAYRSTKGQKFWVITEWDRSVTTVLLPEDY